MDPSATEAERGKEIGEEKLSGPIQLQQHSVGNARRGRRSREGQRSYQRTK